MTYQEALDAGALRGVSRAGRLPFLAMMARTLSHVHAINPTLVYEGAKKRGISGNELAKLKPAELGDLMFVD